MAEHFYQVTYTVWQSVGELFLQVDFVSRDMRIQLVMNYYYYYCYYYCYWKYAPRE